MSDTIDVTVVEEETIAVSVEENPSVWGEILGDISLQADLVSYVSTHGGTWGNITGTLSNQTDLSNALSGKLTQAAADLLYSALAHNHSGVYDAAGTASGLISSHESTYAHSNIAHTNRAALDLVSGTNTGDQDLSGYQTTANKVISFQITPDDTHYPSEKLVKDSLDGKSATDHNHDLTYLGISAKAADSDKLDGNDSTAFSPAAGSSSITTVGTLSSGSIPYSLLTGTPTIPNVEASTAAGQLLFGDSGGGWDHTEATTLEVYWDDTNKKMLFPAGSATHPSIAFGDGDSGLAEQADDNVAIVVAGAYRFYINTGNIYSPVSGGATITYATASATAPAHSFNGDSDTGIGRAGANQLSLIAGGLEAVRLDATTTALYGQNAQAITVNRHTTAATAGNNLTVQAGGAVSGGTDKNGGNAVISGGIATGSGSSQIEFKTATAGASGTTDRTPDTKITVDGNGNMYHSGDSRKSYWGAGNDMTAYYDGTGGYITTNDVAASDLNISCGTDKTLVLTESVWDDIQFAIASGRVGVANYPDWDTFTTNTGEYKFAVDDYIDLGANEMAHWWKEGTVVKSHLHVTLDGANSSGSNQYAKFAIYFAYADDNEVWTETTSTGEITIPTGTADMTNMFLTGTDVDLTGKTIGTQVKIRIKRIAATSGTEYPNHIFVTQCGVHAEKNTLGSRQVGVK